tara:strand:- start:8077 stop:8967 length:891 start_codon:yes stop_codon:yes gene_type:complete
MDYASFFEGEDYQYGATLADIGDLQSDYIADTISQLGGGDTLGLYQFGEDFPTLDELVGSEIFRSEYMDDLLAEGNILAGEEGITRKKFGKLSNDELIDFFEDLGYQGSEQDIKDQFADEFGMEANRDNIYSAFFGNYDPDGVLSSERAAQTTLDLIEGRRGLPLSVGGGLTQVEGLQDRGSIIAGKVADIEAADTAIGQTTQQYQTNLAGGQRAQRRLGSFGGQLEDTLGQLQKSYSETVGGLQEERARRFGELGSTMAGFREQDRGAVFDFYETAQAGLGGFEAALTEELGLGE